MIKTCSYFLLARWKTISVPCLEKSTFSLNTLCGVCFKVQILYPKRESILNFQSPLFPLLCPGQYFQQHLPKHNLHRFSQIVVKRFLKCLIWRKEWTRGLFLSAQFSASRQQVPWWKLSHYPSYYFTAVLQHRDVQGCLPSSSRNSPFTRPK